MIEPKSVAELQDAVRAATAVRALGSRHSFNAIADSAGDQISLTHFRGMELDGEARTVTVGGGATYGDLARWLEERGFALHNLASLPHITVVGAVMTGTHGSGVGNGSLASAVAAMEFVDGRGEVVRLSRAQDGDRFAGAVVALGALGMVFGVLRPVLNNITGHGKKQLALAGGDVELGGMGGLDGELA